MNSSSTTLLSNLDQSSADLVLLSTSLNRSKRLTEKMSLLLTGFDDRLSRLEKTIIPIHNDTRKLTRINANIDQTISAVDKVLAQHDAAIHQEVVIQNGADPKQLGDYISSLDEVVKSLQAHARLEAPFSESQLHNEKLLEMGVKNLSKIFSGWAQESTGLPLSDPIRQTAQPSQHLGFSSTVISKLHGIYDYLQKISNSLNDQQALQDVNQQIMSDYSSIRSKYVVDSLKSVHTSSIEAVRSGDGSGLFCSLISCLLDMFNVEYRAILSVFKGATPTQIKAIYSQVISAPLEFLSITGQSINSVIKRSLSSYIEVAFDTYAMISGELSRFEEEVRRPSGRKENEFGDLLHAFKGSCLRSLPEFIVDTRTFGEKLPVGSEISNTMTSEMTIAVVEYLKMLCRHADMVESFLVMLGDGNWVFGSNAPSKNAPSSSGPNNDEVPLLIKYLDDALSTLYNAIEARSKNIKLRSSAANTITSLTARNGVGAIYMLNNFTYIRRELLESTVIDIRGEQLADQLNKKVRTCKVRYLEIWSPLISALMDAGEEVKFGLGAVKSALPGQQAGAERREVKDRFGRFNEAFDEVIQLHQTAQLDQTDAELKEWLRDEIGRMIIPTYAKFAQRHEGGQFSKNPSKYLKFSADQLEERLDGLFQ